MYSTLTWVSVSTIEVSIFIFCPVDHRLLICHKLYKNYLKLFTMKSLYTEQYTRKCLSLIFWLYSSSQCHNTCQRTQDTFTWRQMVPLITKKRLYIYHARGEVFGTLIWDYRLSHGSTDTFFVKRNSLYGDTCGIFPYTF